MNKTKSSEYDVIKKTKYPSTSNTIAIELKKLGINDGDTLLVHSSLSSMGWVCGGAAAAIIGIMTAAGENGNIVMPAFSTDNSDPAKWSNPAVPEQWRNYIYLEYPAFDPDYTPTRGVGIIPEVFRSFPNVRRSYHPQVSFCAMGPMAEEITSEHDLTPQFGEYSPLGKLYAAKAKVLLIGCGYESCSCFHMGESMASNMKMVKNGAAVYTVSSRQWVWFNDYDYDSSDFHALGESFEKTNEVIKGNVGMAECRLFDLKTAVDYSKDWIEKNR